MTCRFALPGPLVGLRLDPLAVETVKSEYNEALNHYFRTKDLQILLNIVA